MFKRAVPILGTASSEAAEAFYCGPLGFELVYAYRPDPSRVDPCYLGLSRDGVHLVVSSFGPDGPPGTRTVRFDVDGIEGLRDELQAAGVETPELLDQTWGTLELHLQDPDGNKLAFCQPKEG